MARDLLLLSNSSLHGHEYLQHAAEAIEEFLGGRQTVHFAPFALRDRDGYAERVQNALRPLGVEVIGLHAVDNPRESVESAEILFVGGGNSFRLLKNLQALDLIEPVRERVLAGQLSYMGSSAGTNMACPTLRTTNDMPIVQPESFDSFGLVPFQINPHYTDADPASLHMGETREKRLEQFLEENDIPVLAMREGAWTRVRGDSAHLGGTTGALVFQRGMEPRSFEGGDDLSFLFGLPSRLDYGM